MNEQLIRDIVDVSANKQVIQLTGDLEKNNKALQDNILAAKQLNDVLSQSKGFADYNKNSAASAKAQEQLAKLTAARQLQEEKLAAFRAAEQTKADARAAKELANEQKLIDIANKKTAELKANTDKVVSESEREAKEKQKIIDLIQKQQEALEKQNKAEEAARKKRRDLLKQTDPYSGAESSTVINSGSTVNSQNLSQANAANNATSATNNNTKAVKNNTSARKISNLELEKEKIRLAQNALAIKNLAKEQIADKGSLDQRRAALLRLQRTFDGLSAAERSSPFGQRLQRLLPNLNEQVLNLERSTGRSQRNVGNYTNAIGGLGEAVSEAYDLVKNLANILPGVGIAGLIGFAAGPIIEYISNLDTFKKKAIDVIRETAIDSSEYSGAIRDINALKTSISEFQKGLIGKTELVDRFNESIGKQVGELKTATEVEAFYNSKAKDYVKAMFLRAQANAALESATNKAGEAQKRAQSGKSFSDYIAGSFANLPEVVAGGSLDLITFFTDPFGKKGAKTGLKNAITQVYKDANKAQNQGVKDLEKEAIAGFELFDQIQKQADLFSKNKGLNFRIKDKNKPDTSSIDTLRAQIEAERNAQDAIAKDEQKSLDTRLAALNNFVNLSERLNELDAAKKIKQGKNVGQARAEQNTEDEKVESDAAERKYKINERAGKDLLDLIKSYSQRELDVENNKNAKILESTNEVLENIENRRSEAQQKLNESYANRLINQKQFEAESLRISNDAAKESLETQIDALQQVIDSEKEFAKFDSSNDKKLAKDQRDLTALKIRLSKLGTDAKISDLDREIEKQKKVRDSIVDFSKEAFDFLKGLSSSTFESRLQDLDSESKALDKNTKRQIENVNESVASEEDKANQINLINARQEAKQAEIDERVRQTKIRQAKADKAAAIASIIINYAVGYSKNISVLGFLGLPLNAILAATAALQIATVLAQPIPAYKGGKSKGDNYSGSAWVGDGGMSELVIEPNGSMWVTPSTPTLTNVSSGTEIISGPDFKRMLAKPNLNSASGGSSIDLSALVASQNSNANRTIKALKDMPVNMQITTDKGHMFIKSRIDSVKSHIGKQFGRRF